MEAQGQQDVPEGESAVFPEREVFASSRGTLLGTAPGDSLRPVSGPGVVAPGSKFGVYLVGECIGEGGMARVFRAEHEGLRRQVALKVLLDGFAREAHGRERFLREARIAAAIKHPNVVNIFDVGVQDDIPYLVMELLEGVDLEAHLSRSKHPLDEGVVIDIMVPVIAGLIAVHDAGIVHRDLKPGNIFLSQGRYADIEPKLLDFGISKDSGRERMKLTHRRMLMGTPFYVAPEGIRGDEMTPLSDQYSLGVVMYECAVGRPPFEASTLIELSRLIPSGEHVPPAEANPQISKKLAAIISRAMSVNPADRYEDLRELGRQMLMLAGQRTRVTWGLSFGEPPDVSTALATPGSSGAPDRRSKASARPWTSKLWRGAILSTVPLLGLAAALFFWQSRRSSTVVEAAPAAQAPGSVPLSREGAERTGWSSGAGVSASPLPEPSREVSSVGRAAADTVRAGSDEKTRRTPRETPPSRAGSEAAARSAASRSAAARFSAASDAPDWLIPLPAPSMPRRANDARIPVGANGAPILD